VCEESGREKGIIVSEYVSGTHRHIQATSQRDNASFEHCPRLVIHSNTYALQEHDLFHFLPGQFGRVICVLVLLLLVLITLILIIIIVVVVVVCSHALARRRCRCHHRNCGLHMMHGMPKERLETRSRAHKVIPGVRQRTLFVFRAIRIRVRVRSERQCVTTLVVVVVGSVAIPVHQGCRG